MQSPHPASRDLNSAPTPDSREERSIRSYLGWIATNPGGRPKEEVEWRLMEAERLDDQRLQELSLEFYGY